MRGFAKNQGPLKVSWGNGNQSCRQGKMLHLLLMPKSHPGPQGCRKPDSSQGYDAGRGESMGAEDGFWGSIFGMGLEANLHKMSWSCLCFSFPCSLLHPPAALLRALVKNTRKCGQGVIPEGRKNPSKDKSL